MEIAARAKKKSSTREGQFRYALDMCAKTGDLAGALALYESAVAENLRLSAYHFNSLLYIISTSIETFDETSKKSSIDTSFAIFDRMVADGATPTEATITSMARIAAQRPGGGADLAFDLVRTMRERYGTSPRLRTYSPALSSFCRRLEADKAYAVEYHMVSMGVVPEEPEIAALLEVSAKVGREEKVYGYLHKLRGSAGCVADSTAEILEGWFRSERAMEVGISSWDAGRVKDAILMNGGGWHGLGWLGEGGWDIRHATVNSDGDCSGCGRRLACVDIDRMETDKFAVSVATLALGRESKSNFRTFQVKTIALLPDMLVTLCVLFCFPSVLYLYSLFTQPYDLDMSRVDSLRTRFLVTTEFRNKISKNMNE